MQRLDDRVDLQFLMKSRFTRSVVALMLLQFLGLFCYAAASPGLDEYIKQLHSSHQAGTLLAVHNEFRERLKQDIAGGVVHRILEDPDLRSLLYVTWDSAPDEFVDLIISTHLTDDSQWESTGGLFRSPSGGMASAIAQRLKPNGVEDQMQPGAFPFVLENKAARLEIAKQLKDLGSNKKLDATEVADRRMGAWEQIVRIVNSSYDRLLEEEKRRRASPDAFVQPSRSSQELKTLGGKRPSARFLGNEPAAPRSGADKSSWWPLLGCFTLLASVALIFYRVRIRGRARRPS